MVHELNVLMAKLFKIQNFEFGFDYISIHLCHWSLKLIQICSFNNFSIKMSNGNWDDI